MTDVIKPGTSVFYRPTIIGQTPTEIAREKLLRLNTIDEIVEMGGYGDSVYVSVYEKAEGDSSLDRLKAILHDKNQNPITHDRRLPMSTHAILKRALLMIERLKPKTDTDLIEKGLISDWLGAYSHQTADLVVQRTNGDIKLVRYDDREEGPAYELLRYMVSEKAEIVKKYGSLTNRSIIAEEGLYEKLEGDDVLELTAQQIEVININRSGIEAENFSRHYKGTIQPARFLLREDDDLIGKLRENIEQISLNNNWVGEKKLLAMDFRTLARQNEKYSTIRNLKVCSLSFDMMCISAALPIDKVGISVGYRNIDLIKREKELRIELNMLL